MKKKILFIFILFSIFFIPRVVFATSTVDRIHFIKNESGAGDAIVIESNGHFGLVDTMNPGPDSPLALTNPSLVNNTDNGTKVYNYLKKLGCTYLDFVVISHNHAENGGGISELQELVTSDTIVFYKEDIMVNDDVEEALGMGNHAVYSAALDYLNNKSAIKCNVLTCNPASLSNSFIANISKYVPESEYYDNNLQEKIMFNFGDYGIRLYNLYTLSNHRENLNSIVTHIIHADSSKSVLLMGDIESSIGDTDYDYSKTVSNLIDDPIELEYPPVVGIEGLIPVESADIVKAANQGDDNSNSYYSFYKLKPRYYIIPDVHVEDSGGISPKRKAVASILMAKKASSADSYYTSQSDGAIVAEFSDNDFTIKNFSSSTGSESSNTMNAIQSHISSSFNTGWFDVNYSEISNKKLIYLNNGTMLIGKQYMDGHWYYFETTSGIMAEGIVPLNGDKYYHTEKSNTSINHPRGSMQTGFITTKSSGYYYFRTSENDVSTGPMGSAVIGWNTIDGNLYYFRTVDDEISPGFKYSAILGFAVIDGNKYYFRTAENDGSTGPKGSALKNSCIKLSNKRYCFDENAHVSSEETIVDVPTTESMCEIVEYTGSEQVLTKPARAGYTWGENVGTAIGNYSITATLQNGYIWSDDTTEQKTITCRISGIKKAKPALVVDSFDFVGTRYEPEISGYDSTLMIKSGTTEATYVGNYSIIISLSNTDLYEWEDGTTNSVVLNWVINKGYTDIPIVHDVEEYYDGNPHTVIIDEIDHGTLMYSLDGNNWSELIPTRTAVGSTLIYAKVFGNSQYNDSVVNQGTITILKSQAPSPVVTNYRGGCDGEPHSIIATSPSNGTIYYSTDNVEWSTTNPFRIDVGVTTVYVKVAGDANHEDSEVVIGEIRILGEDEYAINDYDYSDQDGIVYGVNAGTTCAQFKSKVVVGYGYQVTVDCTQSNVVYTGGKVRIKEGNTLIKEYSIVVVGDANGDGSVGILDYIKIRKDIMDIERLGPIYEIAADMNKNQVIDIIDYIRIRKIIMEEE